MSTELKPRGKFQNCQPETIDDFVTAKRKGNDERFD